MLSLDLLVLNVPFFTTYDPVVPDHCPDKNADGSQYHQSRPLHISTLRQNYVPDNSQQDDESSEL